MSLQTQKLEANKENSPPNKKLSTADKLKLLKKKSKSSTNILPKSNASKNVEASKKSATQTITGSSTAAASSVDKPSTSKSTAPKIAKNPESLPKIQISVENKKLIKTAMKAYKDSSFSFDEFEKIAPKKLELKSSYLQIEKFFVAKQQKNLFDQFLKKLK